MVSVVPFTILSVDDERDVTELVSFHLSKAGYEVITAASGREALERVQRRKPDLIVLDLMLPDIDGFGVCEILRRHSATAVIPIVILTAWATNDARHLGLELGALDYLTKPFSPKELVQRVARLLNLRCDVALPEKIEAD
jgi:DNA-binding response OmpR family regulator